MGKILPNKKTDANTVTSTGTASPKQNRKSTAALLIFGSILVYAVFFGSAVYITYNLFNNKEDGSSVGVSEPWVPTTYDMMTESQISVKLYKDTGKGLGEIENATPNKELLPSFEKAYSAAQAMYYIKNYTKSIELYAFADIYNAKAKNYIFYLDYAGAAQKAQNIDLFNKQTEAAKNSIKADKSIDDTEKTSLITAIDEKLSLIKLEQQ